MLAAVRENEGSSHRLASTCSASSNVPFPPSSMKSVLFSHQQKLALLFCKGGQRVPIFGSVTSVFMETMLKLRALEERRRIVFPQPWITDLQSRKVDNIFTPLALLMFDYLRPPCCNEDVFPLVFLFLVSKIEGSDSCSSVPPKQQPPPNLVFSHLPPKDVSRMRRGPLTVVKSDLCVYVLLHFFQRFSFYPTLHCKNICRNISGFTRNRHKLQNCPRANTFGRFVRMYG